MKKINNYQKIIKKAWSVRLAIIAILLSILEIILPIFAHTMQENLFTVLSIIAMLTAIVARIIAQKDL